MVNIKEQAQKADPGEFVELFVLDCTPIGGTMHRFTRGEMNGNPVVFGGQTYTPVPIECDGWEWRANGQQPQPKLRLSNIGNFAGPIVFGFGDARGAILTRIRTFKRYLDGQPDANPGAVFPLDVFKVNRKSSHTREVIEWELATPADQAGLMIPSRQCLKDSCPHSYRVWTGAAFSYAHATCPYTGSSYFNEAGTATTAANDRCGRKLSDCVKRFGQNALLPFWGFPGMQRL